MLDLQSIYFGQKHRDFDHESMELVKKIKRLAKQHQRQCENSCNGYGVVKGQIYYTGCIDDYARRTYGQNVKDRCIEENSNIFYLEAGKIEDKIKLLIEAVDVHPIIKNWKVEFQGDPRGATVKLYYNGDYIEL